MFTLLRNFRTLFMLTISQHLEGPVDAFDTTRDNQLNAAETQALLESAEAKNIVGLAEVDTLDASVEIARNIDFSDGLDKFEQQTIQYLATKIQKLMGGDVQDGSIDGNIGRGSRADISAASGIEVNSNENLNQAVLDALTTKAVDLTTIKRAEFALAAEAASAAEAAEASERQSNLQVIAGFDWENRGNASEDEIKALQQALQDLGKPINVIDGVITPGGATEREFNKIQDEVTEMEYSQAQTRLEDAETEVNQIAGPEDAAPTIIKRDLAEDALESLQQEMANKAVVYSKLEMSNDPTAQELKNLMKQDPEGKLLLSQLQADMKLLKDDNGQPLYTGAIDGHNGIDRAFGPGTAQAVTKALEMYGSITAIRRAARIAEVVKESELNTGSDRTNKGIDIVAQVEGYEAGDLEAFLAEKKCPDNMPENIKQGTPEMQQAWIIGQAIEMGDVKNGDPNRLTLIEGLSRSGNDRIIEVMGDLRANFETSDGQAEIIQSMSNGVDLDAADFSRGEVGTQDYQVFELGGKIIDTGLLDSAYIATGSDVTKDIDGTRQRGTMEVPIWNPDGSLNEKFSELNFANATYINGAIVMTVKNGCEGNLVIIPVQREKYVPPVVPVVPKAPVNTHVPRRIRSTPVTPEHPPIIIVPEENPDIGSRKECHNGDWTVRTWVKGEGFLGLGRHLGREVLIPNYHQCNGGDGDNNIDNDRGEVSTTTGTEGGGDEGGGNSDSKAGSGSTGGRE